MSEQRIKIPRLSDRTIADSFKELSENYSINTANINALGFANLGNVNLLETTNEDWQLLLNYDSYLINTISLNLSGFSIAYFRGGNYPANEKSPIFDEIVLNPNNTALANKDRLSIIAFLNKRLRPFESDRFISCAPSVESSQLLAIHQSTLERLEHLNEDLVRQSSDFRTSVEKKYDEKIEIYQTNLNKQKERAEQDLHNRLKDIDVREQSLNDKLKTIDDRDNTHARREIRNKMLDDVKERINQFGVSKTTENKRKPVQFGIFILCLILIILLVWTGYEIYSLDKQNYSMLEGLRNISSLGVDKMKTAGLDVELIARVSAPDVDRTYLYWLWIRFSLFSLGLLGSIIYYIKWQNKWADQHINAEFQLQQFYVDVNRANWVIESCLEWRKETNSVIPKTLIGSITNGLFLNIQSEPDKVIHPADELASALMGSASKLKLKIGDNELDFDKPNKISKKPLTYHKQDK